MTMVSQADRVWALLRERQRARFALSEEDWAEYRRIVDRRNRRREYVRAALGFDPDRPHEPKFHRSTDQRTQQHANPEFGGQVSRGFSG